MSAALLKELVKRHNRLLSKGGDHLSARPLAVMLAKDTYSFADPGAALLPKETAPEKRYARFVVTTADEDREGDVVVPRGCEKTLDEFLRNPVWYYDHAYRKNNGTAFPVGAGHPLDENGNTTGPTDLAVADRDIRAGVYFDAGDDDTEAAEIARDSWRLVRRGFLKGASIGFVPSEAEKRGRDSYTFYEWKLTEISVTGLPANQNALRAASLTGPALKSLERLAARAWSPGVTVASDRMPRATKSNENEARDSSGRWTSGGSGGGASSADKKPAKAGLPPDLKEKQQAAAKYAEDKADRLTERARRTDDPDLMEDANHFRRMAGALRAHNDPDWWEHNRHRGNEELLQEIHHHVGEAEKGTIPMPRKKSTPARKAAPKFAVCLSKTLFSKSQAARWLKENGYDVDRAPTFTASAWVYPQAKKLTAGKQLAKGVVVKDFPVDEDEDDEDDSELEEEADDTDDDEDEDDDKEEAKSESDKDDPVPHEVADLARLHDHHEGVKAFAEDAQKLHGPEMADHFKTEADAADERMQTIKDKVGERYPDRDFDKDRESVRTQDQQAKDMADSNGSDTDAGADYSTASLKSAKKILRKHGYTVTKADPDRQPDPVEAATAGQLCKGCKPMFKAAYKDAHKAMCKALLGDDGAEDAEAQETKDADAMNTLDGNNVVDEDGEKKRRDEEEAKSLLEMLAPVAAALRN